MNTTYIYIKLVLVVRKKVYELKVMSNYNSNFVHLIVEPGSKLVNGSSISFF